MLSRFRSVVGFVGFDSSSQQQQQNQQNHHHHHHHHHHQHPSDGKTAQPKFPYFRPYFLKLSGPDEISFASDKRFRPIIVPRDGSMLPWFSGYAECINAGKSLQNEDQAIACENVLKKPQHLEYAIDMPYAYFGMFDGHAGTGASLSAANQLHHILHEKLVDVLDDIWEDFAMLKPQRHQHIDKYALITGALESSFLEMDQLIAEDRLKYGTAGGCTALVALFILGSVFVANAGDSRAVICGGPQPKIVSHDFTPETERKRIGCLAEVHPSLLGKNFSSKEYDRRLTESDLGKRVLYKTPSMMGWSYKTVAPEDIKKPLVSGTGKRSRVMGTIGVTRGFGDHDLGSIHDQSVKIKPFLSALPEVVRVDVFELGYEDEMVLVMGTDGLWDVTTNDNANANTKSTLLNFPGAKHRYISVAQALVAASRGKMNDTNHWLLADDKQASIDDISVFVIPIEPYYKVHESWMAKYAEMASEL